MNVVEILLLSIGLGMDCLAVSLTSGVALHRVQWRPILLMAFLFGFFQGAMPVFGWGVGYTFSRQIEQFDHWIVFGILLFLGLRMIRESYRGETCKGNFNPADIKVVLTLAVATSIDALAVGLSFAIMQMNRFADILFPVLIIGGVSFVMSVGGLLTGIHLGKRYAGRCEADLWGGLILIAIGTKILIEHIVLDL